MTLFAFGVTWWVASTALANVRRLLSADSAPDVDCRSDAAENAAELPTPLKATLAAQAGPGPEAPGSAVASPLLPSLDSDHNFVPAKSQTALTGSTSHLEEQVPRRLLTFAMTAMAESRRLSLQGLDLKGPDINMVLGDLLNVNNIELHPNPSMSPRERTTLLAPAVMGEGITAECHFGILKRLDAAIAQAWDSKGPSSFSLWLRPAANQDGLSTIVIVVAAFEDGISKRRSLSKPHNPDHFHIKISTVTFLSDAAAKLVHEAAYGKQKTDAHVGII